VNLWGLAGIVMLSLIITNWAQLKFWLLTFWYNFPLIGRMARLSKDIDGFDENHKWFYSEERLCDYHYYAKVDKNGEAYEEAKAYRDPKTLKNLTDFWRYYFKSTDADLQDIEYNAKKLNDNIRHKNLLNHKKRKKVYEK